MGSDPPTHILINGIRIVGLFAGPSPKTYLVIFEHNVLAEKAGCFKRIPSLSVQLVMLEHFDVAITAVVASACYDNLITYSASELFVVQLKVKFFNVIYERLERKQRKNITSIKCKYELI